MWAWRCYRSMSSSTPRETTGALPEWSGIQKTDKNMIIDPILQQYRAVMRAALQEHIRHHARAEEALQYSSLIATEELTELLKPKEEKGETTEPKSEASRRRSLCSREGTFGRQRK